MTLEQLPLEDTHSFSDLFLAYLSGTESLKNFYNHPPVLESFEKQIKEKSFPKETRHILQKALQKQYDGFDKSASLVKNIESVTDEKTFTVTTGHQLNIFTGPLYFIYKIITVINACKELQKKYPEYRFVPVYWMASEDHDFEEINHFQLFGKTYQWETEQKGAVGRFNPNSIESVLDDLPERIELFEKAYREHKTLADATRCYVNDLFGEEGLVVLDADDADLKACFQEVMLDDVSRHIAKKLVDDTSTKLEELGYKSQVYAREINFFYLDDQLRERIVYEKGNYYVVNTEKKFSEAEIKALIQQHPEKFSPNVILRPLYQEMILPNLAYVGGSAEIVYWLQLKSVFDHFNTAFPVLMPRNFALVISKAHSRRMRKISLNYRDLFMETQSLISKFLEANAEHSLQLKQEKKVMEEVFASIKHKAMAVDKSLEGFIGAEINEIDKILIVIEKRLKKSEEKNQATAVKQIETLKEKLFPGNSLQERKDNFLNFYINNLKFIEEVTSQLAPFDYRFNVLIEEDS